MAQNVDPRTVAATNNRRKDSTKKVTEKRDNHNVTKRLQTELMQLMMYEGLHYKLSMAFPSDYSVSAPKVKFLTPCFHPNVDTEGNICLDILKEEWVPTYTVSSILLSIQGLLAAPNIKSPLNLQAAQLWENPAAFRKTLHEKYKADSKRKGQGK
ncbi:ubiquitin-conjugating enzyme E2 C-like isoform X2 [Acanthaster planci]|uniref:Ubiquitin-conjugating enzyme E2 C-like isoform X2 n=1 Tax=Acanthaster planci TaxID=133434 RepID=A0A8B7YMJ5_ACAPL|nr:ubiquitin-conjugating enzyme E2 C-like isoform X2 [Acanthaster planci]